MNAVTHVGLLDFKTYKETKENITNINISWFIKVNNTITLAEDNRGNIFYANQLLNVAALRPCIYFDSCNLKINTKIIWYNLPWTYIGNNCLLCDIAIEYYPCYIAMATTIKELENIIKNKLYKFKGYSK